MDNSIKYNGTFNELCEDIAETHRQAYNRGQANAQVGLLSDGRVVWTTNSEELVITFVKQVGDVDASVGVLSENGFDDDAVAGLAECWRDGWLTDTLADAHVDVQFGTG